VRLSRKEILAVYDQGPDAVVELVTGIVMQFEKAIDRLTDDIARYEKTTERLDAENRRLAERIKELEARLNMNSRNSSKPPSSDGYAKPPAVRRKTGKPPGGQKGHEGRTLLMVEDPDWEITYPVTGCASCGRSLEKVEPVGHERRLCSTFRRYRWR